MTVPNKGHGRLKGIKSSRKRRSGYIRFSRAEESWTPHVPEIKLNSTIFKVLLIIAIAIPVSLIPAYGYYSNIYLPSVTPAKPDPFTTLWNGQISPNTGTTSILFKQVTVKDFTSSTTAHVISVSNVVVGNLIIVSALPYVNSFTIGACAGQTVADSLSNVYASQICNAGGTGSIWTSIATTGGTDSITFTSSTATPLFLTVPLYTGVNSIGANCQNGGASTNAWSCSLATPSGGDVIFGSLVVGDCATTVSYTSGETQRSATCGAIDNDKFYATDQPTSIGSTTWSGTLSATKSITTTAIVMHASTFSTSCGQAGYKCFNSSIISGDITLDPNATGNVATVLSTSQIDLSTGVNQSITFGEGMDSNFVSKVSGQEIGWFLTLNGTITNSTSYNPLNDNSVTLLFLQNWTSNNQVNYYVYMQRATGTTIRSGFLGSDNPYPSGTCPQTSTIFLCNSSSHGNTNNLMSLALNFTGNSNGSGNGVSYICIDFPNGGSSCSLGGRNNVAVSIASTNKILNYTQPWINIQQKFYVGFWAFKGHAVPMDTSTVPNFASDNLISLYSPSATKTEANSFIGFLGSTLGGAWNAAAGLLGPVVAPVLNLGNSILSVIISGLIQFVNLMVLGATAGATIAEVQIQGVMNTIGAFIGWGPIGTQFFSFASGVITYFTTGLGDALTWLLRLIGRSIDLIKTANFWVGFYLNGVFNFLQDALNLISEVVVFAQKITIFVGSSYAFIVILFFLWYTADMGLAGVHAWFETMKWIAFISFDFLERMINFGISSVTWLFGRIPTLDGTTLPELPTIAIGGGPIWPSTDMTALREGNFFAYFGQMVGVAFLIFFETSGLPGSIGSNVTGTAAGTMAPFVTMLLILISITGFLFILNIPAKMARGAFGLDDLKPTSLSNFSTGPIATGGVSGHLVRKHPERKAKIVVNRGLGVRGLRPHLRRANPVEETVVGVG